MSDRHYFALRITPPLQLWGSVSGQIRPFPLDELLSSRHVRTPAEAINHPRPIFPRCTSRGLSGVQVGIFGNSDWEFRCRSGCDRVFHRGDDQGPRNFLHSQSFHSSGEDKGHTHKDEGEVYDGPAWDDTRRQGWHNLVQGQGGSPQGSAFWDPKDG